jgi:threonine synthase
LRYVSTRGDATPRPFSEILLEGLAPDGGLYLPAVYPRIDAAMRRRWRGLAYADLAFEILSLYIDDIPPQDLRSICRRVYAKAVFGSDAITPLKRLDALAPGLALLQLSNGPTLAFKDMAMQLLGALFEYELARRGQTLNILGATSGDTGSAAEHAMRGKRGIQVFMLSPQGRMSPFQQAQMFSLQDPNIHNLTIDGVFDDCQDIVKAVANDLDFKRRLRIGSVNSINWARLVAQVVYYVAGWLQATTRDDDVVDFAVPSGNFGNICAGHVARVMGLPIGRLVCATNENDVLDEFFRSGRYAPRGAAQTHETSSPSMDISKASNFERFVFDLLGHDETAGARVKALFSQGEFTLTPAEFGRVAEFGFVSRRSTHAERVAAIRACAARTGIVIDPHTADGLNAARQTLRPGVPMLVLETALPAKFAATIREALGRDPERPPGLEGIEALPRRCTALPADASAVKRYIEDHGRP